MKLKLKRIDPVKYGLLMGIIMALMTFIMFGIFMLFGGLFSAVAGEMGPMGAVLGGGLAMLIFGPIMYFVLGFIFGWIGTMIMNFVLKKIGGLEMDFDGEVVSEISKIGE